MVLLGQLPEGSGQPGRQWAAGPGRRRCREGRCRPRRRQGRCVARFLGLRRERREDRRQFPALLDSHIPPHVAR